MSRLSKKMSKSERFLASLGVDEDDAEEVTSAVLRYRNVERAKKLKSKQSGVVSSGDSQRPASMSLLRAQSSMSGSNSSRSLGHDEPVSSNTTTSSRNPSTITTTTATAIPDLDSMPSDLLGLGKTMSSPPLSENSRPLKTGFSSAIQSEVSPLTSPITRSSPNSPASKKKSRSASVANFSLIAASNSSPNLFDKFSTPKASRIAEEDIPSPSLGLVSDHDAPDDDDVTITSMASLQINVHNSPFMSERSPQRCQSPRSPMKGSHDRRPLSLKNIGWGVSSSSASGSLLSKDKAADIDATARSVVSELNLSLDNRSEMECLAALTRLHQYHAEDFRYYQDCLGREGACKAVSVVLTLFSASTRICLETVKAISLLCQHGDSTRDTFHTENAEELGGHGTCFSVIRILSSSTHVSNAELVEETCRAIGKLSISENNNKTMTNGGCCETLIGLLKGDGEDKNAVVSQAVIALRHMSEKEETMAHLLALGVCEAVVETLNRFQQNEVVSLEIMRTMIALASTSQEACTRLGEVGACKAVLDAIRVDDDISIIFEIALVAIEVLLSVEANMPRMLQASICDTLVTSLQKHADVDNVAINACRVVQLFSTNTIIRSKLCSAGICEIMRRLFSIHIGTPCVMQACCAAVATLAADHIENKAQLTAAGVCEFVIMTIQKYSVGEPKKLMGSTLPTGSDLVVWQASWALRMLSVGLEENRSRLQNAHVCEALQAALQRHASCPDPMIQVFRTIIVLASDAKQSLVAHMGVTGICKAVVRVMRKNQRDAAVCKLGCQVIVRLAAGQSNLPILLAAKASEEVSSVIMVHASMDTQVTEWGCKALHALCIDDYANNAKARTGGEVEAVVWAIQRQGNVLEVAEWSTKVFVALACMPANSKKFGGSGGCEAIISLAKAHSRVPSVCDTACQVIRYLAKDENNRAWLGAAGGCDVVGTVLHHHSENGDVCTSAVLAVGNLACNHEGNSARLRAIGMCETSLKVLERHVNHEACADATCYAVYELSKFKENVYLMSDMQVCEKVVAAMIAHNQVDAVDKHALQAIQRLSLPEFQKNFSVLSNEHVIQHIVNVLCSQEVTTSCDVSVEGCKVINHLAVTDHNKLLLGEAGACRALITMLKIHHDHSELVVAHVAVSCAKLCKGCEKNVNRFMDQSSCELFLECMDEHKSCENTIISLFQCLYYLSSAPSARCLMLGKDDMFRDVVKFIPRVKQDGLGVFWCLRLIVALAWDSDSRDMLHKTSAYKIIPAAGLGLKDDRHVMLASLLALEVLLTGYTAEDECFARVCSSETCELINYALETYQSDVKVAMAVCRLLNACVGKEDGGLSSGLSQVPGSPVSRPSSTGRRKSAWATLKGKFFAGSDSSNSTSRRGSLMASASAVATSQNSMEDTRLGEKAKQMRTRLGQGGACMNLPKVISSNLEELEVVTAACEGLLSLSADESNLELIGKSGAVEVLVSALKRFGHSDKHLMTTLSQLIASLASVSKTHGNQFGALGACDLLATALSVHYSGAEASEAGCRAVYHLSLKNVTNQNLFGEAGIAITLKTILQHHCLNLSVSLSAISATYAVLKDHFKNSTKFAAITTPKVFLDLLTEFAGEGEVVKHTLWVLNCVRQHSHNKVLVINSQDSDDEFSHKETNVEGDVTEKKIQNQAGEVILALSQQRVRDIVNAIQQHSQDESVALFGCDLISSVLMWGDSSAGSKGDGTTDGRVYLLNDSHTQLSNFFDAAGACEMLNVILNQHNSNTSIISSSLHAIGLLLRAQARSAVVTLEDQMEFREDRMSRFGSLHDCEVVLKLLNKYGASDKAVLKYATLVLSNILFACEDEKKLALIGDSGTIKTVMKMLMSAVGDQGVSRHGCLFINRLSVAGDLFPALLLQGGACGFLLGALNNHLQIPSVVENALHAVHALCRHHAPASDQLGNFDVCQALACIFTEYPVTSINEPVAFALCRAVASLADENGNNCLKFGKVGACEDIVKQLIHFLNGPYIAIIRDSNNESGNGGGDGEGGRAAYCELVALWSCRAIGCLAKDPSTWPTRSGQVKVTGGGFNENRVTLGDVGACEAISQVLKNYSGDEHITQWALWAALNLCEGDDANTGKLARAGALKCVTEAAVHFADNESVVTWASEVRTMLEAK